MATSFMVPPQPPQPSIEERERLMKPYSPHTTGFTPRPVERLASRRHPMTTLDIECRHFLRTEMATFTHQHPLIEFRVWQEASKHEPPYPERPDDNYDSNVWRNFRRKIGFSASAEGRKISEMIAAMYPVNVPPPSKVGNSTFEKYINEKNVFFSPKTKAVALKRVRQALRDSELLKLKAQGRQPPIDRDGRILPPKNFKHYPPSFTPVAPLPAPPPPANQKTDMFGQSYIPRSRPLLSKLVHRLNHPTYDNLQQELEKRQQMMEKKRSDYTSRPITTPISLPDTGWLIQTDGRVTDCGSEKV